MPLSDIDDTGAKLTGNEYRIAQELAYSTDLLREVREYLYFIDDPGIKDKIARQRNINRELLINTGWLPE